MKSYCFVLSLLAVFTVLSIASCGENDGLASDENSASIYGTVTDFHSGEAVPYANVMLIPGNMSTLSGTDGMFEFTELSAGKYYLYVSKSEYENMQDTFMINLTDGKRFRRDIQIKRGTATLDLTDANGNAITQLDFGADASVNLRSFNIFNRGSVALSCSINYSCPWIKAVSDAPSSVQPGATVPITIEIDRTLLAPGINRTYFYVVSNNGSIELLITAENSSE